MAGFVEKISVDRFLALGNTIPVVDVRSPGEYNYGHIPGAFNIPLFDNEQRAIVGTIYKQKGNLDAVLTGIDLAAPFMTTRLQEALVIAKEKKILVHCWRGGMRSEAMAWLFSLAGLKTYVLQGGYKAYRNYILDNIGIERKYVLLGGLTGSGKTELLKHLASEGLQVTDLEGLACHKGSAFGALGQPVQPSSEHFANLLYSDLIGKSKEDFIWLEDESRNIGSVFMPDNFFNRMLQSPVIALMMSMETRLPRLIREYTKYPQEMIIGSIMKISKRLGGERTKAALDAVHNDDYATAIRITLEYYDKAYNYGLSKRKEGQVIFVNTETDDIIVNAEKVRNAFSHVI